MFTCPHCGMLTDISDTAKRNLGIYQVTKLLKTQCCGKGILATPVQSFTVAAYAGSDTEDDWGQVLNKSVTCYQNNT